MKKFVLGLFLLPIIVGCTEQTTLIPECKDGLLHYEYKQVQKELNFTTRESKGILVYQDGTPVKCVK